MEGEEIREEEVTGPNLDELDEQKIAADDAVDDDLGDDEVESADKLADEEEDEIDEESYDDVDLI